MDVMGQYHHAITTMLKQIADTQGEAIGRAARRCADAIAEERYLYVIGTGGHPAIAPQEMFWRAGGLVPIYPILDAGFLLSHGAWRSNLVERTPGYVIPILKYHGVGKGDVLIVCNAYGINAATIDAAQEGKRLGATVIGVSHDDLDTLKKFSTTECRNKFAVGADADQSVMKAYDAVLALKPDYANRTSYVITPDGKVLFQFTSLNPYRHVANPMSALKAWLAKKNPA